VNSTPGAPGAGRPGPRRYRPGQIALVALGLVFFGYVVARAARVAISFDEVQSFYYYIKRGFLGLFKFDAANNHFLNTLLTWLVTRVAGTGEFALRIPNVLAYAAYLVYGGRILIRYARPLVAVCGFILLNANPYLLDFFSISRGYGLALGFAIPALFYFLRFIDDTQAGSSRASKSLTVALAAAGAAVLANFTLLIVYLSLALIAGLVLVLSARRRAQILAPAGVARTSAPLLAGAIVAAVAVFVNFWALTYDLRLSPRLFEPVSVRVAGLTAEDRASVEVVGLDLDAWDVSMSLQAGLWTPAASSCLTGIVLKIPGALLDKVEDVEVRIGSKTFSGLERIRQARAAPRTGSPVVITLRDAVSLPHPDIPQIAGAINWKGRTAYNAAVRGHLAVFLVVFGGLLGLGAALGALSRRGRIFSVEPYLPLWRITLALAALAAGPIYLLQRKGEFYIGGRTGLVNDTFLSLLNLSLYGQKILEAGVIPWILAGFGLAAVLLLAGLLRKRPGGRSGGPGTGLAFAAILFLTTAASLAQHAVLASPYLSGRSALFFIPLTLFFLIFALASADTVQGLRLGSRAILVALAVLCLVHFTRTANTWIVFDWRRDADHKAVVADLERIYRARPASEGPIRLGLDFNFNPGMVYLKDQRNLFWLHLEVVPPYHPEEYYYLSEPFDANRMILVKQYPTGNILVKEKY
jgi:hypothetical protein